MGLGCIQDTTAQFAFFTKKRLILLSLISIFTFGILKYYPDIKNLSTLSILDNSFIMDQEKKLLEIENKIVSNKEKLDLYGKSYDVEHFKLTSKDMSIPEDKRLNFDIWFNKKNALILKVTYSRMGNWEYRVKKFE